MSESHKKLTATLQTLLKTDKPDFDFGIYRIINQRRDEINRFLEDDLLPQVKQAFEEDYLKTDMEKSAGLTRIYNVNIGIGSSSW